MAALAHPNVAVVHHAGRTDGQVYVVMEYVDGGTLRERLRDPELGIEAIVEIFLAAGRGLAAAHAVGIVHRDFKPDNVLVGSDGRIRVADFGLALVQREAQWSLEPMGDAGDDTTMRVGGTPRYMSPEQRRGGRVGPASDQYSWCVALHEALYGCFPGQSVGTAGRRRVPRRIAAAIQRGLAPDPGDRHLDMEALLRAIEPAGRSRVVSSVVLGGAIVGVASAGWILQSSPGECSPGAPSLRSVWTGSRRSALAALLEQSPQAHAPRTSRALVSGIDVLERRWAAVEHEVCNGTRLPDPRLRAAARACLSDAVVELETAIDGLFDAGEAAADRAIELRYALPRVDRCTSVPYLAARISAEPDEAAELDGRDLVRARTRLAVGDSEGARVLVDDVVARARAAGRHAVLAEALELQASLGEGAAEGPTWIIARLRDALLEAEAAGADELRARIGASLVYFLGVEQGQHREALEHGRRTGAVLERIGELGRIEAAALDDSLGRIYLEGGELPEAIEHLRRAAQRKSEELGDDHPSTAGTQLGLGRALLRAGRFAEADLALERALGAYHRTLGPLHPDSLQPLVVQAELAEARGDLSVAVRCLEDALLGWELIRGPDHSRLILPLNGLGRLHSKLGEHDAARAYYSHARWIAEREFGPEHVQTGWALANEAESQRDSGAPALAYSTFSAALACMRGQPVRAAALEAEPLVGRAEAAFDAGDVDAALADLAEIEAWCAGGCAPDVVERAAALEQHVLGLPRGRGGAATSR